MKKNLPKSRAVGAALALGLLGGLWLQMVNAQDQPPPPSADNSVLDNSTAPPPGVDPSSPLAQVIRLAQSGVSEDVIMAYVTNSTSTFNLNTDQIIYLKDLGVPDSLVTAMMQRDQALQAQGVQPSPPPAPAGNTVVDETAPPSPTEEVTVNYFYDSLAPYGAWVDVNGYGRCWRPTVVIYNGGWQPYCDHGHWIYTDDGWYWISDYSWGWAPFHYGRWFRDARFGWCWCPDTVWGPSWVTWRYSADYCGWAPLPPRAVYHEGVGFFYNGAAVSVGFDFGLGASAFVFVPTANFCDPHPRRHRIEAREEGQIFNRTTVINNFNSDSRNRTFINRGIDPDRITAITHKEIHPVAIQEAASPVARGEQLGRDGRTLMVNRPRFTANPSPRAVPRPAVGSPYQPPNNRGNNNPALQYRNQPGQPNSSVNQPQTPRAGNDNFGSQGRGETAAPAPRPPAPANRYVPPPQSPPSENNWNSSTDTRRYVSPRMQQAEPQTPRAGTGYPEDRRSEPAPAPAPPPPQPRNYTAPRNEPSPSQSHPNYSPPPTSGGQSHGSPAPASSGQPQRSSNGRDRNQNGQ